jgi:hypothetical protein
MSAFDPAAATARSANAAAATVTSAPNATTATATSAPNATTVTATSASCVSAAAARFRHSFDGAAGTTTITAVRPLCTGQTQSFSLASYTAPAGSTPGGLFVYDVDQATITSAERSATLKVTVPSCSTHVYAVTGTAVPNETTSSAAAYTGTRLGSIGGAGSRSTGPLTMYAGGDTDCRPAPKVVFTNACSGTFTATVSNAPDANVATVLTSGTRLIRVFPGRTTTLTARKGRTLTFRASTFTSYVGTWRTPETPCTAAPAASVSPAIPVALAPSVTASPATASSASATAETTPGTTITTNPAALTPAKPTAQLAKTGMGTGSIILIAIGFLMIGVGVMTLTRLVRAARQPA